MSPFIVFTGWKNLGTSKNGAMSLNKSDPDSIIKFQFENKAKNFNLSYSKDSEFRQIEWGVFKDMKNLIKLAIDADLENLNKDNSGNMVWIIVVFFSTAIFVDTKA